MPVDKDNKNQVKMIIINNAGYHSNGYQLLSHGGAFKV